MYALSVQNGSSGILSIYDDNLKHIKDIGQTNSTLPYYFPSTIEKILVNGEFYFLLEKNQEINLMNKHDGLILRKFFINSDNFCLYLDQYLIIFDKLNKIYSSNFEGVLDNETEVEKLMPNNQLIGISNGELIFFDSNLLALTF